MEKYKALYEAKEEIMTTEEYLKTRPGRCAECANAGFSLFIEDGDLKRKCKKCNHIITV